MILTQEKSKCEKNQKIVVSKDAGQSREHRAKNPEQKYDLRHYKLDGEIFVQEKCCDFLLRFPSIYDSFKSHISDGNRHLSHKVKSTNYSYVYTIKRKAVD